MSNAENQPTGHGPEGCDENGPAAALLVGYVSIKICALLAPCRKEQERMRIVRMFHEEITSGMLGAVFKIHQAQEKLNSVNFTGGRNRCAFCDLLPEHLHLAISSDRSSDSATIAEESEPSIAFLKWRSENEPISGGTI